MKPSVFTLSLALILNTAAPGQYSYSGKTFIDQNLNQINFLNDSILLASFMVGGTRYELRNSILELTLPHKLLYWSQDTIRLAYIDVLTKKRDTMLFVN